MKNLWGYFVGKMLLSSVFLSKAGTTMYMFHRWQWFCKGAYWPFAEVSHGADSVIKYNGTCSCNVKTEMCGYFYHMLAAFQYFRAQVSQFLSKYISCI